MIEKMTRYDFILPSGMKDGFLESLRELGVVDITRSSKPVDTRSEEMLGQITALKDEIRCIRRLTDPRLEELKARRSELLQEAAATEPWGSFDKEKLEAAGVKVRYYSIQEKRFDPVWEEQFALCEVERKDGMVWFVVLGDDEFPIKENAAPARSIDMINAETAEYDKAIAGHTEELKAREDELPALEARMSELQSDLSLYLAGKTGETAAEDALTLFCGFAPEEEDARLCAAFDEMEMVYLKDAATVEDNPPISFRNNRFVKMFELLTDMYGRPAYDGFDPTPYISVFFLLFFAMCIGDMAYGLLLAVIGLLLRKSAKFAKFAPLVVTLGLGTAVVGFFFHTFFSIDFSQWEWIPEGVKRVMVPASIAGYDGTMILALVIGIIHLALAMIVKTFNATRNKGFLESLATWGWTVLFVGSVGIGAAAIGGFIETTLVKTILIALGVVCAIGIFPLNNLHRNPLKNIGSGLWDTYNFATGILGDVLSYLRLYALGLAGAMLGFAFNDLASKTLGDGGLGWIPFVLIVVVGHTLNLAMAALGAFVHPLRLNFLEFFKNSDYNGIGLKYNPLKKQ